jgi:hypothetical protein
VSVNPEEDDMRTPQDDDPWAWDDVMPVVKAANIALEKLLGAGRDRVVYRDGQVRVLRPEHDGYRRGGMEAAS